MKKLGYLRRCMDRRFGEETRRAFEKATGLGPDAYWDEAYPPGGGDISESSPRSPASG